MAPLFIGIALPPKLSLPSTSLMKPPPVTQQPPSAGGLQSPSLLPSGTHAPQADGWVPGRQTGGLVHTVLPLASVSHCQPPPLWSVPPLLLPPEPPLDAPPCPPPLPPPPGPWPV